MIAADLTAAWITAGATLAAVVVSALALRLVPEWKSLNEERVATAEALRHTRDPLLRAAFDLQSRYYNIVLGGFLERYLPEGSEDSYALRSTLWLVGQYLGWVEILRREVQYLDLGSRNANRKLQLVLSEVAREMASDSSHLSSFGVIFRAEQRAIGEFMVTTREEQKGGSRLDCLGYADFLAKLEELERAPSNVVGQWSKRFSEDLRHISEAPLNPRLIMVQHSLIHLVDLLDPDRARYPEVNSRGRLPWSSVAFPAPKPDPSSRRVAKFRITGEPWPAIGQWAENHNMQRVNLTDGQGPTDEQWTRTYRGRMRPNLLRLWVVITQQKGWLFIGSSLRRRDKVRPVRGSLRFTWQRKELNSLLGQFDRPTITVSTAPARWVRRMYYMWQRLRQGIPLAR